MLLCHDQTEEDLNNIPPIDFRMSGNDASNRLSPQNREELPRLRMLQNWSYGVRMPSSGTLAGDDRSVWQLRVSLEMVANLIYLSRRTETHRAQQHGYLDWAAKIMEELGHHPMPEE
jgi:hypothetical protein